MEPIKINLKTPVSSRNFLTITSLIERDGELHMTFDGNECYGVYEGQKLTFARRIYDENGTRIILTEDVTVLREDIPESGESGVHTIHTTLLPNNKVAIQKDWFFIKDDEEDEGHFESVRFVDTEIDGTQYKYHLLKMHDNHNIFQQDLECSSGTQEVYITDYSGELIYSGNTIAVPFKCEDRYITSADCVTVIDTEEACGYDYDKVETLRYDFCPQKISSNMLIISGFEANIVDKMVFLETKFNPFYYYTTNEGENDMYGNPIKYCHLYEDPWWVEYKDKPIKEEDECNGRKYVTNGDSNITLSYNSYYWNVDVGLSAPVNESTLGSDDNFGSNLIKDIEESLIPDVIDMERVKYSPMIQNGDDFSVATSITMSFHFRERNKIFVAKDKNNSDDVRREKKERSQNTSFTSGNVYTDGWYINPDSGETIWWNGFEYSGETFSESDFATFMDESGLTSDLIGYLNFTDNDVYYRKKKVSQSFIRLTFYNSTDPIEQKLLYYSTVFLDSGQLYGMYLKQMMYMTEHDLFNPKKNKNINLNAAVVLCSADTNNRVDSKIVITNEYDRTKSSEGFNIYLFADDVNFGVDENGEKTIYMKVEFNHAGNGKTLPMIAWPKENGKYGALTKDNFIKSLYIPIKLAYINDRYVYYIPDAYKNENGNIDLVLFEPKLDFVED